MKDSLSQEEINKYESLITSFVRTAITSTEGVVDAMSNPKHKGVASFGSSKNFHTYFFGDSVTIDVYISVIYGYNVPEVVCVIQEKIINSIKKQTKLTVESININVTGVIFI